MKTIVVIPVYNEKNTVISVLDKTLALGNAIEEIVVVDDGSRDGSGQIVSEWANGKQRVTLLSHPTNRGYSQALLTGFRYALGKMESGQLSPTDAVATVDADGQHDPAELPGFLSVMQAQDLDVVWAQRDFSLYSPVKKVGNRIMSFIGSCFAGVAFKDVESGYCVFRLGPLKDALRFQGRDSRYSLSLTLAVALARLGYKISNDPVASIEVFRSRTRLIDGLWDTLAAASAWARVTAYQLRANPGMALQLVLSVPAILGLLAVMVLIGIKSIYLGADSMNNYAHVWYISKQIYSGSLPLHFSSLDDGNALTYPYAFVPWTIAAIIRPVLGDYAVTWTMILGVILLLFVVYRTRLASSPWLLTVFIVVPFTLEALMNFQMSFVWAMLFGYLYAWALERRRFIWSFLWLVLAAGNHISIMGPILIAYTAYMFWRHHDLRKRLAVICGLALVPLVPLAWYTLSLPTVGENSPGFILGIYLITILPRFWWFVSPFFFAWVGSFQNRWVRQGSLWFLALSLLGLSIWYNSAYSGYSNLFVTAHNDYQAYLQSSVFVPGAVYRVVESPRREQGQYYFIQQGAVLSNEFFAESQFRQDWTEQQYRDYLGNKKVDFVVMSTDYLQRYHRNEGQILESLTSLGTVRIVYSDNAGRFTVYDVREART